MNPYLIYLQAELSKFTKAKHAEKFFDVFSDEIKKINPFPQNAVEFHSFCTGKKNIINFLTKLENSEIEYLAKILSKKWRANKVYDIIKSTTNNWKLKQIKIANLYAATYTESAVKSIFKKQNYNLKKIAFDKDLYKHKPYSGCRFN